MFSHVNMKLKPEAEAAFESSYCLDPDTARINGVGNFSPTLITSIYFKSCWDDEEVTDKESTCLSEVDTCDWITANKSGKIDGIMLNMMYSFSFLDFGS